MRIHGKGGGERKGQTRMFVVDLGVSLAGGRKEFQLSHSEAAASSDPTRMVGCTII